MRAVGLIVLTVISLSGTFAAGEDSRLLDSLLQVEDPKFSEYVCTISQDPDDLRGVEAYLNFSRHCRQEKPDLSRFQEVSRSLLSQYPGSLVGTAALASLVELYDSRRQSWLAQQTCEAAIATGTATPAALWASLWLSHDSLQDRDTYRQRYVQSLNEIKMQEPAASRLQAKFLQLANCTTDGPLTIYSLQIWLDLVADRGEPGVESRLAEMAGGYPSGGRKSLVHCALGDSYAQKALYREALEQYAQALLDYPFEQEFEAVRGKLSQVYLRLGMEERARFVSGLELRDPRMTKAVRILLESQDVRALADAGRGQEAGREYERILEENFASPEESGYSRLEYSLYNLLLREKTLIQSQQEEKRKAGDATSLMLEALGPPTHWEQFEGLAGEHSQNPELALLLFSQAERFRRQADFRSAERVYRILSESFPERYEAFYGMIELLNLKLQSLDLLGHMSGTLPDLQIDLAGETLGVRLREASLSRAEILQEEIGELLFELEQRCFVAPCWAWACDSAKTIYLGYRALGEKNKPKNLFLRLLRSEWNDYPGPEIYQELAQKCREYEHYEEAVEILRLESSQLVFADQQRKYRTQMQIISVLADESRDYKGAMQACRDLIREVTGTRLAQQVRYRLGEIAYEGKDYNAAIESLSEFLKLGTSPSEALEANKLLSLCHFRKGDYPTARGVFRDLLDSERLTREESRRYSLLTAYSYLYRQQYKEAYREFQDFLQNHPGDQNNLEITRLVEKLKGVE